MKAKILFTVLTVLFLSNIDVLAESTKPTLTKQAKSITYKVRPGDTYEDIAYGFYATMYRKIFYESENKLMEVRHMLEKFNKNTQLSTDKMIQLPILDNFTINIVNDTERKLFCNFRGQFAASISDNNLSIQICEETLKYIEKCEKCESKKCPECNKYKSDPTTPTKTTPTPTTPVPTPPTTPTPTTPVPTPTTLTTPKPTPTPVPTPTPTPTTLTKPKPTTTPTTSTSTPDAEISDRIKRIEEFQKDLKKNIDNINSQLNSLNIAELFKKIKESEETQNSKSNDIFNNSSHIVRSGETLGEISTKFYDTCKFARCIYQANKKINNIHFISVGMMINIPSREYCEKNKFYGME